MPTYTERLDDGRLRSDSSVGPLVTAGVHTYRMTPDDVVLVTGAGGLVGHALERELRRAGYERLVLLQRHDADLTDRERVIDVMTRSCPTVVFHLAARVSTGSWGTWSNRAARTSTTC